MNKEQFYNEISELSEKYAKIKLSEKKREEITESVIEVINKIPNSYISGYLKTSLSKVEWSKTKELFDYLKETENYNIWGF